MDGSRVLAAMLVSLLGLLSTAFNLDTDHVLVRHGNHECFGTNVTLAGAPVGSKYSMIVEAVGKIRANCSRLSREREYFNCPVEGHESCSISYTNVIDPTTNFATDVLWNFWPSKTTVIVQIKPQGTRCQVNVYEKVLGQALLRSLYLNYTESSCGVSWCKADVDNDGCDDLLLGEPFYSRAGRFQQGRICILHGRKQGSLHELAFLYGNDFHAAHFGSSISCIGDVDQDGFQDVAVGAPGEEDGGGALYVFRGSPRGLDTARVQRIPASAVGGEKASLAGLGAAISNGADVDRNGYNDVAVSAGTSRHVVLLRARPVVRLSVTLLPPTTDDTAVFTIEYVISWKAAHNQSYIEVGVWMPASPVLCKADEHSFCAEETASADLFRVFKTLRQTDPPRRAAVNVTLKRGVAVPSELIDLQLKYSLITQCGSWDVPAYFRMCPMVDPEELTTAHAKLNHTMWCRDHPCHTDLALDAQVVNTTWRHAGQELTARIEAAVSCHKDPAFLATLVLEAPGSLALLNGGLRCHKRAGVSATHLQCDIANPLRTADGPKILSLELYFTNISEFGDILLLNISVVSAGQEHDPSNNFKQLNIDIPRSTTTRLPGAIVSTTPTPTSAQSEGSSAYNWIYAVCAIGVVAVITLMVIAGVIVAKRTPYSYWRKKVIFKRKENIEPEYAAPEHSLHVTTEEEVTIENENYSNF